MMSRKSIVPLAVVPFVDADSIQELIGPGKRSSTCCIREAK